MSTIAIKEFIKNKRWLLGLYIEGFKTFRRTGQTPPEAYYALRQLYIQTDGWFNDAVQFAYGVKHPSIRKPDLRKSLLTPFSRNDVRKAVGALDRDGYYVFPQRVPAKYVDELHRFSLETPALLQSEGGNASEYDTKFDTSELKATNYRFSQKDVTNNWAAQAIMADPALLSICEGYFRSISMYCNVHMWWTTPRGCENPSNDLAQLYHFDMDRFKFLNFFLYLTDVNSENGPHSFVRGSHKRKPWALLEDRRFQDTEIKSHYKPSDLVEITGPKGTLMAVDGRGFHKAKMPTDGNRLIFLSSMSSSLFGQVYPVTPIKVQSEALAEALAQDPRLCCGFDVSKEEQRQLALV